VKLPGSRLICLLVLLLAVTARGQNQSSAQAPAIRSSATSAHSADAPWAKYLKQPYIIEEYTTKVHFEADGTQTRSIRARVRIQSALATQKFSRLSFNYDSTAEILAFRSVQILKPDGTRETVSSDSAKDVPSAVTRDAPAYASYREKAIAIPDLQPGDTLEYEIASRSARAPLGGQFWMQHAFLTDAIVLKEILQLDLPKSRHVTLRSPHTLYSTDTTSSAARITYLWKHANLSVPRDGDPSTNEPQQVQKKPVDVEITSFATWDDVARWYNHLAHTTDQPSQEIRAKVAEITQGHSSGPEQIRDLYEYISKNIAGIDLPFSAGLTESHSATQILAQQYASSADKHVLLGAMLEAAGIASQTALLSGSGTFDNSLPSPAQFDRILTAARQGDALIWLDPSSGVAPFRFLPASLRNKPALLLSRDGAAKAIATPADPPFPSTQRVQIEGQVSELGKLTARIRYELRGDNEYVLRLAFHRTPENQWKELAQTVLALDGVHGEIASATPSDPTSTDDPFVLRIEYSQPGFLDWSSSQQKIPIPLLAIGMPDPPKSKDAAGIELGTPLLVTAQLKLIFSGNFTARPPVAVAVSREYATFQSGYHFDDHSLTAERSLDFKMRALPSSRADDYLAFSRAVAADQAQPLVIDNSAPATIPATATSAELFEAGAAAFASGKVRSAIPLLERALQLDPAHKEAWNKLGLSYMRAQQFESASVAFQKQISVNPADAQAHNYLGLALEQQHKNDEAAAAFREQIALDPLDKVAHEALGTLYLSEREYSQAVPELEKAAVLSPEKAELQLSLGEAYASLGQNDQALSAFEKGVALSPSPAVSNAVARSLADHKLELARAQKYAESAVTTAVANMRTNDPTHVSPEQFSAEAKLANYWDTLGWVHFQLSHFDIAQRYIYAAWLLNQRGEIASHLARVYEKRGQRDQAIRTYALALAAADPDPQAKAPLTLLLAGNSQIAELTDQARATLVSLFSFNLGKLVATTAKADFWLVLSPGAAGNSSARASAARFITGSEELRAFGNRLLALDFGPMFPDASAHELLRRGTLACSSSSAACTFTLLPLE
jgi:tetratricopeptide (TPR) repeat protein